MFEKISASRSGPVRRDLRNYKSLKVEIKYTDSRDINAEQVVATPTLMPTNCFDIL